MSYDLSTNAETIKISETSPKYISDNDIVPEDIQNELLHWREVYKLSAFRIGDITDYLIRQAATQGYDVTHERIFRAVGNFTDRKPRTIRYYWETSCFYPPSVREQYAQLSFSTFVFARMLGDKWQQVLDYAAEQPKVSPEALQFAFMAKSPQYDNTTMPACAPALPCAPDEYGEQLPCAQPGVRYQQPAGAVSVAILSSLSTIVDGLTKLLDNLPLRKSTKDSLQGALDIIKRSMPEITKATQQIQQQAACAPN